MNTQISISLGFEMALLLYILKDERINENIRNEYKEKLKLELMFVDTYGGD